MTNPEAQQLINVLSSNLDVGLPIRPKSLLLSFVGHVLLATLVLRIPGEYLFTRPEKSREPEQIVVITPQTKIYWVPLSREIPRISPSASMPVDDPASGRVERPNESVVVKQPNPVTAKQAIWQPEAPKPLPVETPLPDMVAVKGKPAPKPFQPPKPQAAVEKQVELAKPDDIKPVPAAQAAPVVAAVAPLPKFRPKAFVPPSQQPKLAAPAGSIADAPPAIEQTAPEAAALQTVVGQSVAALPGGKKPPKTFVPPPRQTGNGAGTAKAAALEAAPDLPAGGTGAAVTAAVIGLNPSPISAKPPEGSRAAEFSTGPKHGAPAAPPGTGLTIPGISAQGREVRADPPAAGAPTTGPGQRFDHRIPAAASSMSAPLRPGSRTVPRSIEGRFANRTLYTIVVPKPNLPDYTGDWTIWFAELSEAAATPQMRAPVPVRKILNAPSRTPAPGAPEGFVQVTALITKTGKPANVAAMPGRQPQIAAKAAADLAQWEFRPATRNGEAVDVEVVIEIFFRVN